MKYWIFFLGVIALLGCARERRIVTVRPGDDVQAVLDQSALENPKPAVVLSAGVYRPKKKGQALIHLNQQHDGLELRAEGEVVLTAENSALVKVTDASYPAAVNHVLYFGDGITSRTKVSGFVITGANGIVTKDGDSVAEPNTALKKTTFFYSDGGGIKVFGRSSPVIENVTVRGNNAFFCGGGISIEQMGVTTEPIVIRNSHFINNSATLTGAAVDLLPGSYARIEKSEFSGNTANAALWKTAQMNVVMEKILGRQKFGDLSHFNHSSAITVFKGAALEINGSKITNNSAGIDWNGYADWYWKNNTARVAVSSVEILNSVISGNQFFNCSENLVRAKKGTCGKE
jgi:hypothetical protein